MKREMIVVENINIPGYSTNVDAIKYKAMKPALLKILPSEGPGITQAEMMKNVVRHLPEDLFPGGAKSGWWTKMVQLDLEAKGVIVREDTKPIRWHKK